MYPYGEREALRLVHHHPGRLRVRARPFDGSSAAAEIVRTRVSTLPGVISVEHAPRTGSLLIAYRPGAIEPDAIIDQVCDVAGLERPRDEPRAPERAALVAIDAARELNAAVVELTGRRADLRTVVPAAMLGFAALSFWKRPGTRIPSWENLAYWSYQVFLTLHREEIEDVEARARS